ncbi:MAG TPA: hypothetical protein VEI02_12035 [Planctomycetota bacterium]|nr:hypothetical protein [Planctomycetota bacterium]
MNCILSFGASSLRATDSGRLELSAFIRLALKVVKNFRPKDFGKAR